MLLKYKILTLLLILYLAGCKKVYYPDIDTQLDALVVEGLITNSNGPFSIKLSKALPYDSLAPRIPVAQAQLTVRENTNKTYSLQETGNGIYTLPSNFKAITGNSYTLQIKTKEGDVFESTPQKLLPVPSLDSIHGFIGTKDVLYETSTNDQIRKTVSGVDVRLNLKKNVSGSIPKNRFQTTLLVEYIYTEVLTGPPPPFPKTYYFWLSFKMGENENITGTKYSIEGNDLKNHPLCFFTTTRSSYNIGDTAYIHNFVTIVTQYNLNDDAYLYYKGINEQIGSEGRIFDPIASQLNGNIKCTNNPQKLALGLFEVSSSITNTFVVTPFATSKTVKFRIVPNLGSFPQSGVSIDIKPPFWLD